MTPKITVMQIAEKAQVSVATVSRVFNHKNLVSEEMRKKVQQAMVELGFDLDEIILSGVEAPSKKILVNLPTLTNPYYNEIVKGAQDAALKRGYFVLINSQHLNNSFDSFLYMVKKIDIEGVIVLNALTNQEAEKLNSIIPTVQCAEFNEDVKDISYVGIDDVSASRKVMNHIISTGRDKIALLSGPSRYKYSRDRRKGYILSLDEHNIHLNEEWIIQLSDLDYSKAFAACINLLNQENRPNAIFTISDVFAMAAIKAAYTVGCRVPEDLVVTGFDNVAFAGYTIPSITTIKQPMYQLGYLSTEILLNKIEKNNDKAQRVILETELIVRESSMIINKKIKG